MIGVTTNDRSVYSHHLCSELLTELSNLEKKQQLNDNMNKEKILGRITSDAEDQWKIRITLGKCIHPLQVDSHASNVLVNIYTEKEFHQSVNVNKAAESGVMTEFQHDLPGAFKKPLTTKVVLKKSAKDKEAKRKVNKDNNSTDLLLACALLFLGTSQLQLDQVFSCELARFRT